MIVSPHPINREALQVVRVLRLKSSITLNSRMLRPLASWSCMKPIDQTWLAAHGTASGCGTCLTSRLRGLIRRFSSNSR